MLAQVIIRPDDCRALMSILDSLKEVSDGETEHVIEEELENSKDVAEIAAKEDQTSRCTCYCICNVLVVP